MAAVSTATAPSSAGGGYLQMGALEALEIGHSLGLNATTDSDLSWVVQEYMAAPLPDGWYEVKDGAGGVEYCNDEIGVKVKQNPVQPRYQKLVKFIKRQKDAKLPLDELTVMELLDPVRRVADVKEMAGYMGIDPKKEMHLMWVAKMCVLDDLPGGWHEEATPDGTLTYVNAHTGQRTYEHPTERAFKELLERERKKRPPYQSLMPEYYENPPARYREDRTQEGEVLRTEIRPASGTYLDFRDVYGRQFWVDMLTDHVTMDFYLIRQGAAALKVQAIWKGLQVRRQIWEMHVACATIARAWNKYQFDRILKQINKQRLKSTIKIQEAWRLCRLRWACSRQMYKLLGAIGGRPGRAANKRVDGLLHSNYSFVSVYRAVVHLQRSLRETLKRHARAHI